MHSSKELDQTPALETQLELSSFY